MSLWFIDLWISHSKFTFLHVIEHTRYRT